MTAENRFSGASGADLSEEGRGQVARLADGLREISHGRWEGLTRQDVETQFPEEYRMSEADPFTFAPRGGESA